MAEGKQQDRRQGREGNRWVNERPSSEAVAEWFREAVKVPEGLDVADYVGGVTIIEGNEKSKEVVGWKDDGKPMYTDVWNVVYTPYVKVETRVQFWHDLLRKNSSEWEAFLEPVPQPEWALKLPPGFSRVTIAKDKNNSTSFACCTMKATVYKRGTVKYVEVTNRRTGEIEVERRGEMVIDAPPATKMIPLISNAAVDPMSLMKAETGAIGRALGFAGMLIVPGSGVATAEDMREAQVMETQVASAREGGEDVAPATEGKAQLDAAIQPSHDELVALAAGAINALKEHEPEHTAFLAWVGERGFNGQLSERKDPELKQILKKAEAEVEAAEARVKAQAEPEG